MNAIFPGSFDPFTRGHLDIVDRASRMFDQLCIVIATNSAKSRRYDPSTMRSMIEDVMTMQPVRRNVSVDICETTIADYVVNHNVDVIVRALRNGSDLGYEEMVETGNNMLLNSIAPDKKVEHVYLMCRPEYSRVSSTLARELISAGARFQDLDEILPTNIAAYAWLQNVNGGN